MAALHPVQCRHQRAAGAPRLSCVWVRLQERKRSAARLANKRESKSLILLLEFIQRSRTYAELRELAARSADLGEDPNAQRLAKSNPYSVERLMLSKSKIAKQYSTAPGFKNKLESIYKPMSTRQIYYRPPGARFFLHQRRKSRGRKTPLRAGGGPPALRTHPCLRRRDYSRTLYGVPGKLVTASVPWWLVSRPLAASL